MTPERFRQIDQLITLVMNQQESERKAFLDRACEGDVELRRAVESLLACDENAGRFLARPASQLLAEELADDSKAFAAAAPTKAVGRYLVERELGSGGMGLVYSGYDPELGRKVAIKLMRPESGGGDPSQGKARLLREAQALAQLTHPNVIAIHDVGTFGEQVFIAMEYVEGCTLADWLSAEKRTWPEIVSIFVQAGNGLAAAHAKGIVHRDFKPDNLWVGEDGRARVLDFGLARSIWTGDEEKLQTVDATHEESQLSPRLAMLRASLTETGKLLGTPAYMAPEQLSGKVGDARSDQFSYCVALYQALYGELPFRGESIDALLHQVEQGTIEEVPKSRGVPSWLRRVVLRGLSANPADRYESMDGLLQELTARPSVARRRILVPSAVVLLALTLTLGIEWKKRSAAQRRIQSIAVLPLENLSFDPEQEYFADGVTEALITDLAKIRALRVISRTSVMVYKGARRPLPEIGQTLHVEAVLEGSVQRTGDRVQISVQLIQAATDRHLWAERYERDARDVLALQNEVARAVVQAIQVQLTPEEQGRLARAHPIQREAYEAYLKGRHFLNKRTAAGFQKAADYFQQATALQPDYALAYAELSNSYVLLGGYSILPPREVMPKARAAAVKALAMDDTLAEAHSTLGAVRHNFDWDWSGAEREFQQAIALSPGYPDAHIWYSLLLAGLSRHDEAIAEAKRAQESDPLSLIANAVVGRMFWLARQYDQAIKEELKTLDLDPNFGTAYFDLGRAYEGESRYDEAIEAFQRALRNSGDVILFKGYLGHAYAMAGKRGEALKVLDELQDLSQRRYVPSFVRASIYAGLGEKEQALIWLERAYAERNNWLVFLKVVPIFDSLRADPRFVDLMRRVGLSP
jgi:serine/threonine-protein kinase